MISGEGSDGSAKSSGKESLEVKTQLQVMDGPYTTITELHLASLPMTLEKVRGDMIKTVKLILQRMSPCILPPTRLKVRVTNVPMALRGDFLTEKLSEEKTD